MGKNIEYAELNITPYAPVMGEPTYIFDMDGTLAHRRGRGIHDYDRVSEDRLDAGVFALMFQLRMMGNNILIVSGRPETCRSDTEGWLYQHALACGPYAPVIIDLAPLKDIDYGTFRREEIPWWELHMRPAGDYRPDFQVKYEIFDREIRGKYNIAGVFDDRDQCVRLWRDLGLQCYQVAYGDF